VIRNLGILSQVMYQSQITMPGITYNIIESLLHGHPTEIVQYAQIGNFKNKYW